MDTLNTFIDFIKGNNGSWVQTIFSGLFLNLKLWVYLFIFIYLIKKIKHNVINYVIIFMMSFLVIFEIINITDRQNYEVVKYQFELINKNSENLVIVIQGANNPVKDAIKDNQIQVDNTSSRDYDGLGLVESYVEDEKTQVMTYVGTHSFNLTPIRIINMVNDFKLSKPNGKIILVGHSLGAYNIVQALKELNKINVSVDLVILLDTSNKKYNNYDFVVQKNVKNIINYTSPKWSDKLRFFTNSGGQVVLSEGNIYTNYSNLEIAGVEHTTIDNEITTLVINNIQNFLCRNSK
tara:strand:- start:427 stop:1305 length:879 start_codon:yes stop_codon:yes gene_type:complete